MQHACMVWMLISLCLCAGRQFTLSKNEHFWFLLIVIYEGFLFVFFLVTFTLNKF